MSKIIILFLLLFVNSMENTFLYYNDNNISDNNSDIHELISKFEQVFTKDTAKAKMYLQKAIELSQQKKYDQGLALASEKFGAFYFDLFDFSSAKEYYSISLKAYKSLGIKEKEAMISNNLGIIFEKSGDYSSSVSYYLNAFEIYDSLQNDKGLSATANNLGIIYYLMNHPVKAKQFFLFSMNIKKKLHDTQSLIYTYQNLGNVYFELWQYDSATYYYNESLKIAKTNSDETSISKAMNSIAMIQFLSENHDEALVTYEEALLLAKRNNDHQNVASIYDNLGKLYFFINNNKLAINYFDSSLLVAQKYGLKEEIKTAYLHLAEAFAAEKLYKEAFLNMQLYENLKTTLFLEKGYVADIEAIFIKQKQENKILRLEKEKERKKAQLILLGAIIAIIIITGVLVFYIYKIKQKSWLQRTMAEQEKLRFKAVIEGQESERKRIAGDLHDSVGQMLSLSKLHLSDISEHLSEKHSAHKNTLNESMRIIDEACQEVRNISHNLMPGALIKLGLVAAIKELVRKIGSTKKTKINFINEFGKERLDEKIEISLYRVIQEIFNNCLKHSQASIIDISLHRKPVNVLQLVIADNGIGFNTKSIKSSDGIGWKNIYSRLAIINGRLEVLSQKDFGTKVDIQVLL